MSLPKFVLVSAAALVLKLLLFTLMSQHGLTEDLCRWDCNWYISISQLGYDRSIHHVGDRLQANWAFFPLYPIAVLGATLSGISSKLAALVVSGFAFWGFLITGWCYRSRTRPDACWWTWLLLVIAWPYSFLFDAPYSESLYAFLTAAGLLCVTIRASWLAAAASALLTATRPTGFLFAIWFGVRQLWYGAKSGTWLQAMLPISLAPLGLLAFMAFLWTRTGDPLAFVHVQSGWDHTPRNPVDVLLDAVRAVRHGHMGLVYEAGWAVLGGLGAVFHAVNRRFFEAWLCGTTVVVALFSGVLWSMPRFVACNPVVLFAATDVLDGIESRKLRSGLLVALAGIQLVLVAFWYRGAAFLM